MGHSPVKLLGTRDHIGISCATSTCPPATVGVTDKGWIGSTSSRLRWRDVRDLDTRLGDFLNPLLDLRRICRRRLVKSGVARHY